MDNKTIEKIANFLKEFPVHSNQQIYGTITEEKKENWVVRPYRVKYIKIIISQEEIDAEIICISPEGIFGSVRYTNIGTSVFLTEEEAQKRADKKNEELKKIRLKREKEMLSALNSMSPSQIMGAIAGCLQSTITCHDCPFVKYGDCKDILAKTVLKLMEKIDD